MSDPIHDLIPMLKDYLDVSNLDRQHTKELIDKLEKTIDAVRECSINMKIQIKTIETHSAMFEASCRERKNECADKFKRINERIKVIPSPEMMKVRDDEIKEMKDKLDDLMPRIYTAIAVCTGIGGIVGLGLAFVFKKVFGG